MYPVEILPDATYGTVIEEEIGRSKEGGLEHIDLMFTAAPAKGKRFVRFVFHCTRHDGVTTEDIDNEVGGNPCMYYDEWYEGEDPEVTFQELHSVTAYFEDDSDSSSSESSTSESSGSESSSSSSDDPTIIVTTEPSPANGGTTYPARSEVTGIVGDTVLFELTAKSKPGFRFDKWIVYFSGEVVSEDMITTVEHQFSSRRQYHRYVALFKATSRKLLYGKDGKILFGTNGRPVYA